MDAATLRKALALQIAGAAELQRTSRELHNMAAETLARVRATMAAIETFRKQRQRHT